MARAEYLAPGSFLTTEASDRETWFDVLKDQDPKVDENGYLKGEWGRAIVAAVRYEHSHPDFSQLPCYQGNGPAGYVGFYMAERGFGHLLPNADNLEDETKKALNEGEGLSCPPGSGLPEVWSTPICDPKGYHAMMESAFEDTFWISVCMCCGTGVGGCGDPCLLSSGKCCCVEAATYSEDCCGDLGPCFTFQKMCCMVTHQTLWPGGGPNDGVPCCAICNQRCGGESGEEEGERALTVVNTNAKILSDAFMCYYCLCCGCGLSMNFPLVKIDQKCLCVRTFGSTASCWPEDRGICYKYEKAGCCVNICTFPCGGGRYDGIPSCACCGAKCGGEDSKDSGSESN